MSEVHMPTLGALIRQAMQARNMRKVDLTQQMGRSHTFVHRLIHDLDKYPPPPDVLADLRRVLGLSMRDMLTALGYELEPSASPASGDLRSEVGREITRAMIDAVADNDIEMVQGIIQKIIDSHEARQEARRIGRQHASPPEREAPAVPTSHVRDDVYSLV